MNISKESLHQRYSALADDALIDAAAAGRDSYSPEAWQVIQELLEARTLHLDPVVSQSTVTMRDDAVERSGTAVSPYFLWSRLVAKAPWPPDRPLPLSGRDFLAVMAFLWGLVGAVVLLLALAAGVPSLPTEVNLPALGLSTALALAFGISANRPPSPDTWVLAMLYCGTSPFLSLIPDDGFTFPGPVHALGALLVGLMWLLYFARRRATYGLTPWPSVM